MATMLISPLHARLTGQAARRGLIPRVPTADVLLADVETWLRSTFSEAVRTVERPVREQGEAELTVELHPAAPPLVMTASDTGRVAVTAATEIVGPGYHRFVGRVLERMGMDLAIAWERGGEEVRDPLSDATAMTFAERPAAERGYLTWLGRSLVEARARRPSVGAPIPLGLPTDTRYHLDGAIHTALGPRDMAWLDVAVTDTRIATDVTPWWADATDGSVPAEPCAVPDVDRGPLADAGGEERATAVRRGPSAAVEGVPARPEPGLPVAGLGGAGGLRRDRRPDGRPGAQPGRDRRR